MKTLDTAVTRTYGKGNRVLGICSVINKTRRQAPSSIAFDTEMEQSEKILRT